MKFDFKKFRLSFCLIFSLLFLSQVVFASGKAEKIDEFMKYCHSNGLFNGTVLVAENGTLIYINAFGFADFETKRELQVTSPFYLASVSKQFTAMAIMILKERGKLNYEDKLSKFFPQFPSYASQVTIHHLMTHTSGIANHYRLGTYKADLTNREVLEILVKQDTLDFFPGEKYSYSNGGYVLLAMIVATASRQPFHKFMKENIFEPLQMNHSLVYDESKPKIRERAVGFNMYGEKSDYELLTSGAGGIYSNIEDLFKWDRALYTEKLVKASTLAEAYQPFILKNDSTSNYGYGWSISEDETGKTVAHTGRLSGFRTYIERHLKKQNTIAFLTNQGNATALLGIQKGLRNILLGQDFELPKKQIQVTMYKIIENEGVDTAVIQYRILRKQHFDKYDFSESQLNSLGYHLLQKERIHETIQVFKLNVEAFPESSNPYDSLGEGYMADGDFGLAIKNYRKSLELNPDNTNAGKMLKKIDEQITKAATTTKTF